MYAVPSPLRDVAEVRAVIRPQETCTKYKSVPRNSIRSRSWNAPANLCAYSVEKAWVVTRSGNSYDLSSLSGSLSYAVIPSFTPSRNERMVTRSSIGPGSKQKQVQEITVIYSLSNDPWVKYSLQAVCDQGLKPHDRTSARLHSHVLFMESYSERFELSKSHNNTNGEERYTLCRCKRIQSGKELRAIGVPLPDSEKEVIVDGVLWEDIQWSSHSVVIRKVSYPIVRVQFMSIEAAYLEGGDATHAD